jgi:hypothetical protein
MRSVAFSQSRQLQVTKTLPGFEDWTGPSIDGGLQLTLSLLEQLSLVAVIKTSQEE